MAIVKNWSNEFMDKKEYFLKNFAMGTELEVAGRFLYNGLSEFNKMFDFHSTEQIFMFLYNISVGIERLQKILVVLTEKIDFSQYPALIKQIKTHNHNKLQERINKNCGLNLETNEDKFLSLLNDYYNTCRYGRYELGKNIEAEKNKLISFISKNASIEISGNYWFSTSNDKDIKDFIGKVVGGVATKYYDGICAHDVGYIDEMEDTVARSLFWSGIEKGNYQSHFEYEQRAIKEYLLFLLNTKERNGFYKFIKDIPPLRLEIYEACEIMGNLSKGIVPSVLVDAVNEIYENVLSADEANDRNAALDLIGATNIIFDDDV